MNTVDDLIEQVKTRIAASDFKAVVAFQITDHDQRVVIDGTQRPPVVNGDAKPKTTFKASFDTFSGLLDGSISPLKAIPLRQLKFEGTNGVAMHFLPVLTAK